MNILYRFIFSNTSVIEIWLKLLRLPVYFFIFFIFFGLTGFILSKLTALHDEILPIWALTVGAIVALFALIIIEWKIYPFHSKLHTYLYVRYKFGTNISWEDAGSLSFLFEREIYNMWHPIFYVNKYPKYDRVNKLKALSEKIKKGDKVESNLHSD